MNGNNYLAGQRYATTMAQQDRRRRARQAEITAAEAAYQHAQDEWSAAQATGQGADYKPVMAARDALYEVDPQNWMLT